MINCFLVHYKILSLVLSLMFACVKSNVCLRYVSNHTLYIQQILSKIAEKLLSLISLRVTSLIRVGYVP